MKASLKKLKEKKKISVFIVRMDSDLFNKIALISKKEKISINKLFCFAIEEFYKNIESDS